MAYSGNYFYIQDGYLAQNAGYKTRLTKNEYSVAQERILSNETITPEFVGLLLGRATPISERVKCVVCDKEIPEEEAMKIKREYSNEQVYVDGHKDCYEKNQQLATV